MKYLLTTALCAILSLSAHADVVHFKNGDRLSGKVISTEDGKVVIASDAAGELTLDAGQIAKVETSAELAAAAAATEVEKTVAAVTPAPEKKRNWESHVTFNSTFSKGNTESELIQLLADYKLTRDRQRYKAKIQSTREEKDSVTTKELDRLDLGYNYLFADRWFFALNGQFERDPIARIDRKSTISPAIGYDLYNSDTVTLNVQLGGGYTSEKTPTGTESGSLVDWRLEYKQDFPAWHMQAFHDHHIYRNLEGRKNVVLNSQTGLRYNLSTNIHLNVQLNYDYDDDPVPGTEKDDLTFVFGAGVTL